MSASEAALAAVKLLQVPTTLLALLNLNGPLWPPEREIKNNSCFDYVIIGGGTAGCVLANRLSENPNHTVLLIEAGGNPPIETAFPPLFVLNPQSRLDWNFTSTFDDFAAKGQDNITKLTAGKVLGGTSVINHFILARGCRNDFDERWASIANDDTWSYDNVLPYFKKKETLRDPEILASAFSEFHGKDGPTGVMRQPLPRGEKILSAFGEVGNDIILDINANINIGFTQSMFIVADGVRQSTALNYITPIRNRPNLYVLRDTTATKIIFEDKRAVAVAVERDEMKYVYRGSKEIILSAGVYNSPKLLMLSGIGRKEHLESFNITTIADLPVGDNYQDQAGIVLVHRLEKSIAPPPPETVILTKVPFPVLIGLSSLDPNETCADSQAFSLPLPHDTPFLILACAVVFQYRPELCDIFNTRNILHNSLFTLLTKTKPYSRGKVRLNSKNPFEKPSIETGFFKNETDLIDMVKYIKQFLQVNNSTYFKEIGAELIDPEFDECNGIEFGSDEFWRCYILNAACSVLHPTSTCAIGSVVDSNLRVYNVTNLRVVDASVIPVLTSGSPYESVLMVAEKGADMIKADADNEVSCKELYGVVEENNESLC